MLDNREISLLIWLGVFLVWSLYCAPARKALVGLFKGATHRKLVFGFSTMVGYITTCVWGLYKCGVWDLGSLKPTILWSLTAATVMAVKMISSSSRKHIFREALVGGFKISVVLEFIVQIAVFDLWGELLFVPLMALLGALMAVAESDGQYALVSKLLNRLAAVIGFSLLGYACYTVAIDWQAFAQVGTVVSYFLPILLTVLFIPFLWGIATVVAYENVFCRIQFFIKDPKLLRYVKLQLFWQCGIRYYEVNRWWPVYMQERPSTREALRESMVRARFEHE